MHAIMVVVARLVQAQRSCFLFSFLIAMQRSYKLGFGNSSTVERFITSLLTYISAVQT